MILVGEDSVHLAVQLLEVVLDGVGLQCIIAGISTQEVVACKTRSATSERLHEVGTLPARATEVEMSAT